MEAPKEGDVRDFGREVYIGNQWVKVTDYDKQVFNQKVISNVVNSLPEWAAKPQGPNQMYIGTNTNVPYDSSTLIASTSSSTYTSVDASNTWMAWEAVYFTYLASYHWKMEDKDQKGSLDAKTLLVCPDCDEVIDSTRFMGYGYTDDWIKTMQTRSLRKQEEHKTICSGGTND